MSDKLRATAPGGNGGVPKDDWNEMTIITGRRNFVQSTNVEESRMSESNRRPTDYKSVALPTELIRRGVTL